MSVNSNKIATRWATSTILPPTSGLSKNDEAIGHREGLGLACPVEFMRLTLTYDGPLPASSTTNPKPAEKNKIRRKLHPDKHCGTVYPIVCVRTPFHRPSIASSVPEWLIRQRILKEVGVYECTATRVCA